MTDVRIPRVTGRAALPPGRLTLDPSTQQFGLLTATKIITPPADSHDRWRLEDLDTNTLGKTSPAKLLELLADLSPDVSRGLWDFLRFCNPGWTCTANVVGGNDTPSPQGQAVLDTFWDRMGDQYGSPDVVLGRMFTSAYIRGAILAELVLDPSARVMVDLATPDPAGIRFQLVEDPERGQVWKPGQWQQRTFVLLDRPTIRYIPIDPFPGSPYGRPVAAPALFATLFLLGLLHDLRRVVAQQGWTRIDVSVNLAELVKARPELKADQAKHDAFVNGILDQVTDSYGVLEPDDAFIHDQNVIVNRAVGAVDASVLGGVGALIENLERMALRALKTMPLLMGITDGVSEANANRQWEVHSAGIKAIQHYVETLLNRLLNLGLRAAGVPAVCDFKFAELRASEILRDAQTETVLLENAGTKIDRGWESEESMAEEITGHAPVGDPKPEPAPPALAPPDPLAVVAEPGANREVEAFADAALESILRDRDRARQRRRYAGLLVLLAARGEPSEDVYAKVLSAAEDLCADRLKAVA